MKRWLLITLICCMALALPACSAANAATQPAAAGTTAPGGNLTTMQMALGILNLENSSTPLDAQQAAQLLPLWKAARSLGKSDTAAAQENAALLKQILAALTSAQVQTIQSMSTADLSGVAQKYGIAMDAMPAGAPSGDTSGSSAAAGSMGAPGGGVPGMDGGDPPMGGGPGGPPGSGSSSLNTVQATPVAGSFQGVSTNVIEIVIVYLQTKAQ